MSWLGRMANWRILCNPGPGRYMAVLLGASWIIFFFLEKIERKKNEIQNAVMVYLAWRMVI